MPEPPLSPSQEVERIREILVGRQMQQIEERLHRLEQSAGGGDGELTRELAGLRDDLAKETAERTSLLEALTARLDGRENEATPATSPQSDAALLDEVRSYLEELTLNMAVRIDTRANEVLAHLEGEIAHLRTRLENDFKHLHEQKADRYEVRHRFSKLAVAAMEDPPPETCGNPPVCSA